MKVRIREGNDFDVVWAIKRAGQPEDLSTATSMKLTLVVYGLVIEHNLFTVTDNVLSINIPKEVATIKGDYRLVFKYTLPDAGQPDGDLKCKTDVVPFRIVPFTADADDVYTVNTSSDVLLGFKGDKGDDGDDAYQIWLDLGNVGTYEDFIAYLRQPAVDAGASIAALELIIEGNESGRVTAEGERDAAETLRLSAESGRAVAEGLRDGAEVLRIAAEGVRDDNEGDRITAESDRADAEELRDGAELIRLQSEIGRNTAEGLRVNAETGRNTAEGLRASAETGRNTAEGVRVTQEGARQANTAAAISGANEAAQSANTAAGLANTARENIQADLALKAAHGYASDPKTLKEVDDNLTQLAGDVEGTIEMPIAHALNQLKEEVDSLRMLIEEGRINKLQIETLDVISEIRINGSPLIYVRDSAPSFSPDQVPQFYIDTAAGRLYTAKGTGSANDWF